MKKLIRCGMALTTTFLAIAISVSAQERRDQDKAKPAPPNAQRVPQPAQAVQGQHLGDSQLAACLISDNEGEVAISRFVLEKSQNPGVKEFAQQMVKDHNDFIAKLQRFAPATAGIRPESNDAVNPQRRDEKRTTDAPKQPESNSKAAAPKGGVAANPPFHGAQGSLNLIQIKQEIGRECVATFKKELSAKSSTDFDKCYVGQQVGAHLHMGDALKVMKKYASPELRAVLEDGEKTAAEHLDHARTLIKDLESKSEIKKTASAAGDSAKENE